MKTYFDFIQAMGSWFFRRGEAIFTGGKDIDTGGGDVVVGAGSVDGVDLTAHVADVDAHHTESHTVASHSDTTGTGSELDDLTDGSDVTLHTHDTRYFQESEFSSNPGAASSPLESDSSGFLELEGLGAGIAPVANTIYSGGAVLATADSKAGSGVVSGSTSVGADTGTYILKEASSPATPPSGFAVIWCTSTGGLWFKDDTGSATQIV